MSYLQRLLTCVVLALASSGCDASAPRDIRPESAETIAGVADSALVAGELNPLLFDIAQKLRVHNADLGHFALLDVARVDPGNAGSYAAVGHGLRDGEFRGRFEDELFGVFVVDSLLMRVTHTLAILPTQRWRDYELQIEQVTADSVIVTGRGATYGDTPFRRAYAWPDS